MRRASAQTPEQVSIQRHNYLLDLPDRELCREDHKTSALAAGQRGACGWWFISDAQTVQCGQLGEWGTYVDGIGARRGCTRCVATAIRARVWLQRQRLIREHGPFTGRSGGTGRPDRSKQRDKGVDQ